MALLAHKPHGEWFWGIICRKCGEVMSIMATWDTQLDDAGTQAIRPESQRVTCPFCSTEAEYHSSQIARYEAVFPPKEEPG